MSELLHMDYDYAAWIKTISQRFRKCQIKVASHVMVDFYDLYSGSENLQQVVAIFPDDIIFQIPWGHHVQIIGKCKGDREKALFYVRETLKNNWSRSVLMNFLASDLYERQGKAITNFDKMLPDFRGDLAQEMTRDPYNFDFLTLRTDYDEN